VAPKKAKCRFLIGGTVRRREVPPDLDEQVAKPFLVAHIVPSMKSSNAQPSVPSSRNYPALVFAVNAKPPMQEETLVHRTLSVNESSPPRAFLHVKYRPMKRTPPTAGWRINGYAARLVIWSPEEWEKLEVRPLDAQYHPFGVWCALRLE
jgi:hypothetical protein